MDTVNQGTPAGPSGLTAEQVRAACDEFQAALDATRRMLAAYGEMIELFRASGTLVPGDEMRAKLAALEPDDATFAAFGKLDALATGEGQ